MKTLLSSILFAVIASCSILVPAASTDRYTYRDADGDSVVLGPNACTDPKVVRSIPADYVKLFRAGAFNVGKTKTSVCWVLHGDHFDVVDEHGNGGAIPAHFFTKGNEA